MSANENIAAPQTLMQKAASARMNNDWHTAELLYRSMALVLSASGQEAELAVVLYHLAKTLEAQGKYFATFEILSALDTLLVHLEQLNEADDAA
jgi:hypothetical protein